MGSLSGGLDLSFSIFSLESVGGGGGVDCEREGRRNFQVVRPLEAVASARVHVLFGMGWVVVGGWGRVAVI